MDAGSNDVWSSALSEAFADAFPEGVGDSRVVPYRFDGSAPSGVNQASTFMPGDHISANDPGFPLTGSELVQANSEYRDSYRIGVFTEYVWNEVRGRIRHEFEHLRQHLHHGRPLFDFNRFLLNALTEAYEVEGGGIIYNLIPLEFDANCAPSVLLRRSLDEHEIEHLLSSSTGASLIRPKLPPQPLDTLPRRMLAFAFLHKNACEKWSQKDFQQSFEEVARERWMEIFPPRLIDNWEG